MQFCNAALALARRGKPVFPLHFVEEKRCSCGDIRCGSPGKHPRTANGFLDATTDEPTIRNWWERWPMANIGLRTGSESGFVVLDVDPRNGGDATLADLERKHGVLPDTIESLTGGGGRHIYFAHPGGYVKGKAQALGEGLDLKGDGGYVIAPPSLHISGRRYEWEVSSEGKSLAPLPEWIQKCVENHTAQNAKTTHTENRLIPKGCRNKTLTSLAGTMRRRGMGEDAILAALQKENEARCSPPLPDEEVRRIASSVARYEPDIKFERSNRSNNSNNKSLPLTGLKELLSEPDEVTDYLVDGLLPAGGLSLLVAKPKTGKSTLARQLALAVARGGEFLGRKTTSGLAIYLALEERKADVRTHFRIMGANGEENVKIFVGMAPENCLTQLRTTAEEEKPALIIVDTMARIAKIKDINDYSQVISRLEPLLALAREVGAHVLLTHHGKKGDAKGIDSALGSTALSGSVDTIIYLRRNENYRTISSIQRVGEDIPETIIEFDKETRLSSLGGTRDEFEVNRLKGEIAVYLQSCDQPQTEPTILENVEGRAARTKKALRQMVDEGMVARSGQGKKGDPFLYSKPRSNSGFRGPNHIAGMADQEFKNQATACNSSGYYRSVQEEDLDHISKKRDKESTGIVVDAVEIFRPTQLELFQ